MLKKEFMGMLFQFFGASQSKLFQLQAGTRPEELTQVQYSILEYLYFAGDKSLSEVSACLYLAMPNASREVRKLTEKGFVKKIDDLQDKRKSTIQVSADGHFIIEQAFSAITDNANQIFGGLTEEEQEKLINSMDYMVGHLFK